MVRGPHGGVAGSVHSDMAAGAAGQAVGAGVGQGPLGPGCGKAGAVGVEDWEPADVSGGGSVAVGWTECEAGTGEAGASGIRTAGTADAVGAADAGAGLAWELGGWVASWHHAQVALAADGGAALPWKRMESAAGAAGIVEDQRAVAGCRDMQGVGSPVTSDWC